MSATFPLLDQIDITANRHKGSPESNDAFKKIAGQKQEMYNRIMQLVQARKEYGVTVHEVAGAFGKTPNCISGRLSELKMIGKLKKSGERRNGAAVLVAV